MDNRKEEKMQDEVEKNHRVSFESLEILIRRFKDGTFSEIIDDWKWILVRDNGGQWKHVDHGY